MEHINKGTLKIYDVWIFGKGLVKVDSSMVHDEKRFIAFTKLPHGYKTGEKVTSKALKKIRDINKTMIFEFENNNDGMKGLEILIWNCLRVHSKMNKQGFKGFDNKNSEKLIRTYTNNEEKNK